jgi:hypothetical protein
MHASLFYLSQSQTSIHLIVISIIYRNSVSRERERERMEEKEENEDGFLISHDKKNMNHVRTPADDDDDEEEEEEEEEELAKRKKVQRSRRRSSVGKRRRSSVGQIRKSLTVEEQEGNVDENGEEASKEKKNVARGSRRRSSLQVGKRRRSSVGQGDFENVTGKQRRMSSIQRRIRRLSMHMKDSMNKGRRISMRRMSAILRNIKKGPRKKRKKRKKKKKKVARTLIPTDRFSLIRFLEADDVDVDEAMQWLREERGMDDAGNVKWQSKNKSWAQNLVFYRDAEPPPPKPRPRAPGVCHYKGEDTEGNLYVCNNDCIRDRVTKQLTDYCGWHSPKCVCKHHDGRPSEVTNSNRYGMCDAHHLAIKNTLPEMVDPLDAPGVVMIYEKQSSESENSDEYFFGEDGEDWFFGEDGEDFIGMLEGGVEGEEEFIEARETLPEESPLWKEKKEEEVNIVKDEKKKKYSLVGMLRSVFGGGKKKSSVDKHQDEKTVQSPSSSVKSGSKSLSSSGNRSPSSQHSSSRSPSSNSFRRRATSRRTRAETIQKGSRRRIRSRSSSRKTRHMLQRSPSNRGVLGALTWNIRHMVAKKTAATTLQRYIRGFVARSKFQAIMDERRKKLVSRSAALINRVLRGHRVRVEFRKRKEKITRAAYFVQDQMKRFVMFRKKLKARSALNIQRIFRGFLARGNVCSLLLCVCVSLSLFLFTPLSISLHTHTHTHIDLASIEKYRIRNMRSFDIEHASAQKIQSWIRTVRTRYWFTKTIKRHREINRGSSVIQRAWKAYRSRVGFQKRYKELRRAAVLIQTLLRTKLCIRVMARKRRRMHLAALDIQRVFRASKARKYAASVRIEIAKAWNWLRPYHDDHISRKTWGAGRVQRDTKRKTEHRIRSMGIAYPKVQRILKAHQDLRDSMFAENSKRLRVAVRNAKLVGVRCVCLVCVSFSLLTYLLTHTQLTHSPTLLIHPHTHLHTHTHQVQSEDVSHAEQLLDRLERFEHLLPRSRYLERSHTLGRLVSDRYNMNQSVKDLLLAKKKTIKTQTTKIVKRRNYSQTIQIEKGKGPFRHRLKTLKDAKREVNVVERFQSILLKDNDDKNVLGSVPEPLFRSHIASSPSKKLLRRQYLRSSSRCALDNNTTTTNHDEHRSRHEEVEQTKQENLTADFQEMRRNLEEAKHAKIVQQDTLSKRRAHENVFKPYVPIPRVNRRGRFDQTIDVAQMYIHHLQMFSNPEIVFDQNRFTQYALDSFVFLDKHWKRLIEDVYAGTLHPALPVSPDERQAYLSTVKPCPDEALQAEKLLKHLGFHKRYLVSEANFDLKLFRQTKNDDLPLILENAIHKNRSGKSELKLPDILLNRTQSGLSKASSSNRSGRSGHHLVRRRKRAVPVIRANALNDEELKLTWPRKVPWRMAYDEKSSPWNTSPST